MGPRSTESTDRDVIVLGAGPAGTTAATFLARAGFDVEIVEKERFPREHIGESLLPCDLKVFERLDLELTPETGLRKNGAEFYDEAAGRHAEYPFRDGLSPAIGHAFQVDRARFDAEVAQLAERAGAKLSWGTKVTQVQTNPEHVTVSASDGGTRTARYFLDASGQDAFLGRRARTVQPIYGFGIGAVFAHYRGLRPEIRAELEAHGNIKILILPDGWAWLIPLPGGRLSVGRVSRKQGITEQLMDDLHADSPVLQRLTEGGHARRHARRSQLQLPEHPKPRHTVRVRGRCGHVSRPGVFVRRVAGHAWSRGHRGPARRSTHGTHRKRPRADGPRRQLHAARLRDVRLPHPKLLPHAPGPPLLLPSGAGSGTEGRSHLDARGRRMAR